LVPLARTSHHDPARGNPAEAVFQLSHMLIDRGPQFRGGLNILEFDLSWGLHFHLPLASNLFGHCAL
jgi:hypothetical protein